MFPRNWGGKRRFPLYCLIAWHCVELGSGRAFIALSRRTLDYSHNAFRLTRKNRQRHGRPAGKTVSFRPFRGSPRFSAAVAQWIEYWPPKPRVVGSIPASRAISSQLHPFLQYFRRGFICLPLFCLPLLHPVALTDPAFKFDNIFRLESMMQFLCTARLARYQCISTPAQKYRARAPRMSLLFPS